MGTSKDILHDEINKKVNVINHIKTWLRAEIQDQMENCTDYQVDTSEESIVDGRLECAENLLEQIQKWEEEEDEDE